jgi:hypothetical protein
METSEAWNMPSKYNANRALGVALAARMLGERRPSDRSKTRWQALGLGTRLEDSACLALFGCSIPFQDPENDAGLHASLYNVDSNAEDYFAPSDKLVQALLDLFPEGLQIELVRDLKVLGHSREDFGLPGLHEQEHPCIQIWLHSAFCSKYLRVSININWDESPVMS